MNKKDIIIAMLALATLTLQANVKTGLDLCLRDETTGLIVVVKNGKRLEDVYTLIVNLRSGKSTAIKLFQKEKKVFPLLSDASEDGVLALVESNEVEDYLEQFAEENVFGRDRPIDPDGYAILKYKLK